MRRPEGPIHGGICLGRRKNRTENICLRFVRGGSLSANELCHPLSAHCLRFLGESLRGSRRIFTSTQGLRYRRVAVMLNSDQFGGVLY
jgi:hypothetical protein